MSSWTRILLTIIFVFTMAPRSTADQPPPPGTVIPEFLSLSTGELFQSNPIGRYTVYVTNNINEPIAGARVVVEFAEAADIALAPGQTPPFELLTDQSGYARFQFRGSGCYRQDCLGFPPARVFIYVDDQLYVQQDIQVVNSPSPVDEMGLTRCGGGAKCDDLNGLPAGLVGTSDVVWATPAIKLALVEPCVKFTPPFDSHVQLDDAVYMSAYFKLGTTCGCTP